MVHLDKIKHWGENFQQSLMSVLKVPLFSRKASKLPQRFSNPEELVILANGPSLADTVGQHPAFLEDKTLLAVNFSVLSPMFTELKPELYLIADPLFWIVEDNRRKLFDTLARKVTWPMCLFIPARARADKGWKHTISANPNIKVCIYNTTPIEGFKWLRHILYRSGAGMPRPHNVLIPSITMGLRLPFKRIYLAGADHSWLPEISVTDDNRVLMHQKHFYDKGSSKPGTVKQEDLNAAHLHTILYHMHVAFKAYFTLKEYAHSLGKDIINITPGSYIDAFPRLNLNK